MTEEAWGPLKQTEDLGRGGPGPSTCHHSGICGQLLLLLTHSATGSSRCHLLAMVQKIHDSS